MMRRAAGPLLLLLLVLSWSPASGFAPPELEAAGPWTLQVSAKGTTISQALGNGVYDMIASGTYRYGAQAKFYADASRSWGSQFGACYDWPDDILDLQIDFVSPWSDTVHAPRVPPQNGALVLGAGDQGCRSDHTYSARYVCVNFCRVHFRILDTSYADNSGHLTVVIRQSA